MQDHVTPWMERVALMATVAVIVAGTVVVAAWRSAGAADRRTAQDVDGEATEVAIEGAEHVHALAYATLHADPQTTYAGTCDGLWRSADECQTWELLEGPAGRITAIAINPEDPTEVIAGSEVGVVFRTRDGGRSWDRRN